MSPDPYTCELDPETKTTLKVYLFKNIKNAGFIRNNVVKGSWKCAIIKPNLVLDCFQVAVAANKAVVSEKLNTMVTRTVYTEILYNLSLTKNITQSLSKFGIEKDQSLLICFIKKPGSDENTNIIEEIEGEMCPMSELSDFTDLKDLKSVYKLNKVNLDSKNDLLDIIVSRMVTKAFVSH